ncbi:hypothetical protein HELRODRAFT_107917 [Helobdella robusta]|uniref:Inward rectifier potassium channel C-terminal domain-containing protein n=1 Tax=Helobdella robusta TaxID=6412 RepID=T1EED8_HELRO|nr:hypothetical protein HELRODRAFT_107917 [Helobdella robusta]ESN94674.1 hypothetical protein HELRODRAFT_107917 [Helobdella robusta]
MEERLTEKVIHRKASRGSDCHIEINESQIDGNNNKLITDIEETAEVGSTHDTDEAEECRDNIKATFLRKLPAKANKSLPKQVACEAREDAVNKFRYQRFRSDSELITIYPSYSENTLERPRKHYWKNPDPIKINCNPKYVRYPSQWSRRESLPIPSNNSPNLNEYDVAQRKRRTSTYLSNWDASLAKYGRSVGRSKKLRLIQQSGECNVQFSNVHKRSLRYLNDIFTTFLELPWRYNIFIFLFIFVTSWIVFAMCWWTLHEISDLDANNVSCVAGVDSFKTALLFSIETQQTIGYGTRAINDRCEFGFLLLMLQSVFGAVTQCLVTGIIFSKLARPNRRAETVIFSKKAVICSGGNGDSTLNLEFRLGDMRNSQLIGIAMKAVVVRKTFLENGKYVTLCQKRMQLCTESDDDFYYLAWPIRVIHKIDDCSPFWGATQDQISHAEFEILIVLEASCEATGSTVQVKTSYLPSEIDYGFKLAPLFTRTKLNGQYKVDYSKFHETIPDDNMPKTDPRISKRNYIMANSLMTNGSLPSFEDEKS